jgi:hypothetical protein
LLSNDKLKNIEKKNYWIAGIYLLGSLVFWSKEVTLGIFLGFLIVTINFKWLIKIFKSFFDKDKGLNFKVLSFLLVKTGILLGFIAAILLYTEINIFAFLVGTTTILLGTLGEAIIILVRERP